MKGFMIYARTGCSCCSGENHDRGPYRTREEAENRKKYFQSIALLASQYARVGAYDISEYEFEELPDGRLIQENRVYPGFFKVDEAGGIECPGDATDDASYE